MKTIDKVLRNKPLIFLNKLIGYFGYFIVIECDLETREVSGWRIDKF